MNYLAGMIFLIVTLAANAAGPSFDCNLARSKAEKEICSQSHLSSLDQEISELYFYGMKVLSAEKREILKANQKEWLRGREKPFPNLSTYMEIRIKELQTFIAGPTLQLPEYSPAHAFDFEFHGDIEEDFLPELLIQYLNQIAEDFLVNGERFSDRYSGISIDDFNRIKPMRVYYGPARLHGVESGGDMYCPQFWELYISLDAKWRYLREYFDSNGQKVEMPSSELQEADLNKCTTFGGTSKLVFWTNSEEARHKGEVNGMHFIEYIYDRNENTLVEMTRYTTH